MRRGTYNIKLLCLIAIFCVCGFLFCAKHASATNASSTPNIVFNQDTAEHSIIIIPSQLSNATIDFSSLLQNNTITFTNGLNINTEQVSLTFPSGTSVVSQQPGWGGIISAPQVQSNNSVELPSQENIIQNIEMVVEVNSAHNNLIFDKAVSLILPNMYSKKAFYYDSNNIATKIPLCATLGINTQNSADTILNNTNQSLDDCYMDSGDDLLIFTKHFSKFAIYTEETQEQEEPPSTGGGSVILYYINQKKEQAIQPKKPIIIKKEQTRKSVKPKTKTKNTPIVRKKYQNHTLIKSKNNKIYIIEHGKRRYIPNQKELQKYTAQKIFKVTNAELNAYPEILGPAKYSNQALLRSKDGKIYIIKNRRKHHIPNLLELHNYVGREIYNVTKDELKKY